MNIYAILPTKSIIRIEDAIAKAKLLDVYFDKCYFCKNECKKAYIELCKDMIVKTDIVYHGV